VFHEHAQINYLGIPAPEPVLEGLIRAIAREDSMRFDMAAARAALAPHLAERAEQKVTLLSYENFTLYEARDKGVVARRLHALLAPARIMFTLRRQEELLTSWYMQKMRKYIRGRHHLTAKEYFNVKLRDPTRSILGDLDYNVTIAGYEELFGSENVRIFLYEQLRHDPAGFAAAVASFLGVDAVEFERLLRAAHYNPARSRRRMAVARLTARYLPPRLVDWVVERTPEALVQRTSRLIDSGPPARARLPKAARRWIEEHCRDGNRALDARFGGLLRRHGYTL
jgi:hypothetical protein